MNGASLFHPNFNRLYVFQYYSTMYLKLQKLFMLFNIQIGVILKLILLSINKDFIRVFEQYVFWRRSNKYISSKL